MELGDFAAHLRKSRAIVFFSGAGVSTESGVPDFRSPGGVWTRYQPVYFQDFISSEDARVRHWKLKKETYELYKNVKPNIAHFAIGDFDRLGKLLGLITQNVDGLHSLAGISDAKLVELHSTDRLVRCLDCQREFAAAAIYETLGEDFTPPLCEGCGGFLKSATISFGQSMPLNAMEQAKIWSEQAEIFVVLGSSLQVQPAASFPVIAKQGGALLAIINRDETPLDELADFHRRGSIGEFFKQLIPLIGDG